MARAAGPWRRVVAAAVVLVACGFPPQPTSAAPLAGAPTEVTVSARSTLALVSWDYEDQSQFRVEVDETPGFTAPAVTNVSDDVAVVATLEADTTYYLRVTATNPNGRHSAPSSTVTFTTSTRPFPFAAPSLELDSRTATSIIATWGSQGDGLRYVVEISDDQAFSDPTSELLEGTEHTFEGLATETTYYLRNRVIDEAGKPLSDWSAVVSGTPSASLPLRVGSFNILKLGVDGITSWSTRRGAVAATIRDQGADVVGLQEATPARAPSGRRQYADLVAALGSDWALVDAGSKSTGEARTVYDTTRLTLLDHGHEALAGTKAYRGVQRYATWARFEQKSTKRQFIFVNTHLVPSSDNKAEANRARSARQIVAMVKKVNREDLPVIILGDFNTHRRAGPGNGVWDAMTDAGYLDPLLAKEGTLGSAEEKIRPTMKTFNGYRRKAPYNRNQLMIDRIFVSPMRVAEWETVAKLDSAGRFVGTIPSDHNMIRATVYLP